MSTETKPQVDTSLRTLHEVITRLIMPIPASLIDRIDDASKAEYINVTTQKDLLDWACGHGRWRAEITQTIGPLETHYVAKGQERPGGMFGMIIRLHIQTADEGWIWQDGTGSELLSGKQVFGDALTNAYAQALRRACESFGMARELWRRKVIKAQAAAYQILKDAASDIPKAPAEEIDSKPQLVADPAVSPQPKIDRAALTTEIVTLLRAEKFTDGQLEGIKRTLAKMSDGGFMAKLAEVRARHEVATDAAETYARRAS